MQRPEIIRTLVSWFLIGCVLIGLALVPLIVPAAILSADKHHSSAPAPTTQHSVSPYKRLTGH